MSGEVPSRVEEVARVGLKEPRRRSRAGRRDGCVTNARISVLYVTVVLEVISTRGVSNTSMSQYVGTAFPSVSPVFRQSVHSNHMLAG